MNRLHRIGLMTGAFLIMGPGANATIKLVHVLKSGLGDILIGKHVDIDNVGFNSGSRLKAIYLQAADQSGYPTGGWYDTQLQENCTFTSIGDAGIYCVGPSYHATFVSTTSDGADPPPVADPPPPVGECAVMVGYYVDNACSQPVVSIVGTSPSQPPCAYETSADSVGSIEFHVGPQLTMIVDNNGNTVPITGGAFFYTGAPGACSATRSSVPTDGNPQGANQTYWYPVLGAWSQVANPDPPPQTVETWPSLCASDAGWPGYVKAVRQVNLP